MTPSRLRRHDPGEKHTNKGRPGHEESKMIRTMITDRLVNRNEEIICGRPPRKRAESYSHLLPLSLAANLPRAQHRGHESLRAALASAVSRRFEGHGKPSQTALPDEPNADKTSIYLRERYRPTGLRARTTPPLRPLGDGRSITAGIAPANCAMTVILRPENPLCHSENAHREPYGVPEKAPAEP